MDDWNDLKNSDRQIISCTEGGGWGLGYGARNSTATKVGTEICIDGTYYIIDLGFNSASEIANLNTGHKWHSFDLIYSGTQYYAFLDGVSKGSVTFSGSYTQNTSNTIFVGAEAGGNTTTATGSYFKGLISNVFIANKDEVLSIAKTITPVPYYDVTYYPIWRINTYSVTWKHSNGTVIETDTNLLYGATPQYNGSTPTMNYDNSYHYTFDGWYDNNGNKLTSSTRITNNTVYTARFNSIAHTYSS